MALRRAALAALLSVLASVAIVLVAGSWLWYSSAGLQWLAARASSFAGEALRIEGVAGTLARGAQVQTIRFATSDLSLEVRAAGFTLSLASVLKLSPRFEMLRAERVAITARPSDEPRSPPPDSLALPVPLAIDDARIGTLVFDNGTNVVDLQEIHLRFHSGRTVHRIEELDWKAYGHAFTLRGTISAHKPFPLQASFVVVRPAGPPARIAGTIGGNLRDLALKAHARSGSATARATATLHPGDEQPLADLALTAQDIDPHAFDARLPQADLQVEAELQRKDSKLQGPVRLRNQAPGPIDRSRLPLASLQADLVTNFSSLGFTALHVDLGAAGVVTGSGTMQGEDARLELATDGIDLRSLYSTLHATRLSGRAVAHLTPALQSVQVELTQDDSRLALEAERTGNAVRIPTFTAQARGGVAKGHAQIDLGGSQPFSLAVNLTRFDPAAWGDFPRGAINASLQAQGSLLDRAGRIAFEVYDSRWLGAPLEAKGSVHGDTQRIRQADVEARLGGNRLSARGAFGAQGDTLRLRFDALRLALVDKQLRGRLQGRAVVSGTFAAPRFEIDATGAGLAHARYGSVTTLTIAGRGSLDPDSPITLRAVATGIQIPQLTLRSAKLSVEGDRSSHSASVEALGGPVDLRLRLRGALKAQNTWRGTVLELTNRGELPIALAQSVNLRLAAGAVHVEPFELSAVGGRLAVHALDYSKERLRTAGNFQNLPVSRLIGLAGKKAPVHGNLRLSGSWNLDSSPDLRGSIAIARESGDLSVGGEPPIAVGLKALTAAADITSQRIEFRAAVETALANVHAAGRIGAVGTAADPLPYSAASPLAFTSEVDIARVAPMAEEFIDTPIVLRGQVHARLRGGGAIGDPQITGEITARDLGALLPAEGVSLGNGSLKATLTAQAIELDSFQIHGGQGVFTARGSLARAGFGTASLEWRAQNFTALGRPDRKLVVSGEGTGKLENKRVALAGNLRVVEGEFEIGQSGMPTLSSDVVVVGRTRPPPAERRFENLALDLELDLGKATHVTGDGLGVWLSGDLHVFTNAAGQLRAKGTVHTRDGTFQAYGQRLTIDRGNIYFDGPLVDPALDVVALRKRLPVEAGVAITGTLKNPIGRIVSDPPVPQGEALSWLVLGRSANEAGKGELSTLPLAGNLLLGKATSPLKGALHLDELSVGNNATGEFVTFGKRLTDRLYLVFEQGIEAAESLLQLEYNVSRRVTLRLETGTAENSGGGIFYRRRWD